VSQSTDDPFGLSGVVNGLREARERWRARRRAGLPGEAPRRELPSREALDQVLQGLRGAIFPLRLGPPDLRAEAENVYVAHTLLTVLTQLEAQVLLELRLRARQTGGAWPDEAQARQLVSAFAADLPRIRELLDSDVVAAFQGDPAASSEDEVLLCYPGLRAMIHQRVAHRLYRLGAPLVARVIAELAHAETGIDIHPGAQIGPGFFIDHGTGVVIGETTVIGAGVRLYQNVTLGAKSFPTDADGTLRKGLPRHPIVEDDVVIYAGATVLGRVRIGQGSVIGGNVWLTQSVPAGSQVSQAQSRRDESPASAALNPSLHPAPNGRTGAHSLPT
jgi:serine O-acetyltransferase